MTPPVGRCVDGVSCTRTCARRRLHLFCLHALDNDGEFRFSGIRVDIMSNRKLFSRFPGFPCTLFVVKEDVASDILVGSVRNMKLLSDKGTQRAVGWIWYGSAGLGRFQCNRATSVFRVAWVFSLLHVVLCCARKAVRPRNF